MALATLFTPIVAIVACQSLAGIDDYVIGDCKGGPCGAETGAPDIPDVVRDSAAIPADDSGVPCLGRKPMAVRVGTAGNTFCIDSTEVTFEQYDRFIGASIDPSTQAPICSWNRTFQPQIVIADGGKEPSPSQPVAGVDWCDALAYCTWAGKYLCGTVDKGKKVGPVTAQSLFDFHSHQWLLACTAEARLRYPYGATIDPSRCNLANLDAGGTVPVGTLAGCVGGYTGLSDLIGNVWEWYDGPCQSGQFEVDGGDSGTATDGCGIRGGSYTDLAANVDCQRELPVRRDSKSPNIGFRCCSD